MNIFASFLSYTLYNFASWMGARISLWMKTAVIYLTYKKIMKVSTLNPSEFTEGSIINFIQVDAMKIQDSMINVLTAIDNAFQLLLSFAIGFFFVGYYYLILLSVSVVISFGNFKTLGL